MNDKFLPKRLLSGFFLLLAVLVLFGSVGLYDYLPLYLFRIVFWVALAYLTWRIWRTIQSAITAAPSHVVIFFALLPPLAVCIPIGLDYAIFGSSSRGIHSNLLTFAVWGMLAYLVARIWRVTQKKAGVKWKVVTAGFSFVGLCLVFLLLMFLCLYTGEKYNQVRNYHGYCTWKGSPGRVPVERDGVIQSCTPAWPNNEDPRGRRFMTEERLDIAINHYLCNQHWDYQEIAMVEGIRGGSRDDVEKRFTLIRYGSKDEFLRENPDCCQLTWRGSEGLEFPVWDSGALTGDGLVSGVGNGMFAFKHKVRYMDQQGTRKEIETVNAYITVNNCGYPRSKVDGYY